MAQPPSSASRELEPSTVHIFLSHNPHQPLYEERNRNAGTTYFVIATPMPESANPSYFGPIDRRPVIPFRTDPPWPQNPPINLPPCCVPWRCAKNNVYLLWKTRSPLLYPIFTRTCPSGHRCIPCYTSEMENPLVLPASNIQRVPLHAPTEKSADQKSAKDSYVQLIWQFSLSALLRRCNECPLTSDSMWLEMLKSP